MPTVRLPAVAGRFYPRDSETLREEVSSYIAQSPSNQLVHALGCVVPHAGYMYSGHVAGAVFARLEIPAYCILLCPNHTGMGQPLAVMSEGDWETPLKEPALIVASSDMNHYESDTITRVKDQKAIERILTLDPRGLYDVVTDEDISMCGFGPTVAMLTAARQLGATSAELVKYATSGDISGDRDMVVGYAGVIVT